MAEAFYDKIEKDFLDCAICFEQLKDPVGLPCLHGFCFECLQNWHKAGGNKSQVTCPACKKSAPLPENGIRGFPGHFLVKNLKETLDKEKMRLKRSSVSIGDKVRLKIVKTDDATEDSVGVVTSVNSDEISVDFPDQSNWQGKVVDVELVATDDNTAPCDLCDKPADTHCLDCKQYLCNQCHKQHNGFKPMKGHKVVAASDVLSGKVSSKGRHCEVHDELIRYYCTAEKKQVCHDCVNLKTCPLEHERISLDKAARMQAESLHQLVAKCDEVKDEYKDAISKTDQVRASLNTNHEDTMNMFEELKEETKRKLQEMLSSKKFKLSVEFWVNAYHIGIEKTELESKLKQILEVCDTASNLADNGSDHDITFNFNEMFTQLMEVIRLPKPKTAAENLGHLNFNAGSPQDYLKLETSSIPAQSAVPPQQPPPSGSPAKPPFGPPVWKQVHRINAANIPISSIDHIVVFPDGKIAVSGQGDGVAIITSNGLRANTVHNAPKHTCDMALTPDDRFIICGNTKLLCCNTDGKLLNTITTSSVSHKSSPPRTVAIDNKGRIIVGVEDSSISIHYADGTLESQFATQYPPHYISVTSDYLLVVTTVYRRFRGLVLHQYRVLELMNYSGKICKRIQPPPQVIEWSPGKTCCTPNDEIYVINDGGNPYHIFRYDISGNYLGVVQSVVTNPKGMTFSHNGNKIYITGQRNFITIFDKK